MTGPASGEPEVLFERRGALGLITLNRPKALNALTHGMCLSMKTQLDAWARDAAVKAVAITAAGERAFCAGGDIRALYDSGEAKTAYALDFYRDEYILNATIKHYPKPYIAFIKGIVMGGGVGVSVHGSHRVADETVTFAMPETGIGLFPDVGGSHFLPRIEGEVGMYLGLTGARLKLADCLDTKIATACVPAANTDAVIARLAEGDDPDRAIAAHAAEAGDPPLAERRALIASIFSETSVQEILASLYSDNSDWSQATAGALRSKSPTSLKLTYRQLRQGAFLDFDACMEMEFRMVNRVVAGHDFYEGVRAIIIDKDNAPQWRPAKLSEVTDEDIDAYFEPLGDKELQLS